MIYKLLKRIILFLLVASVPAIHAPAQEEAGSERAPLGLYRLTISGLGAPADSAFDSRGRLIVADADSPFLGAFNPDGTPDRRFGATRIARPPLQRASSIEIDRETGEIFALDAAACRVHVFDEAYAPLRDFGGRGRDEGSFQFPEALALAPDRVLVADTGNHRVQVLSREGRHRFSFGTWGFGDGQFVRPTGVAVDDDANIYVADADRHDIQKFDSEGTFLASWGDRGEHPGFLARPMELAIHDDRLYVADSRNHRIEVFTLGGDLVGQWGEHALRPREGEGRFETPVSIAITPDARVGAVCEPVERRIQVFDRYESASDVPSPRPPMGFSTHFAPFCAGGAQTLLMPVPDLQVVDVYDTRRPTPILITRFGTPGRRPGRFVNIAGVAYDPERQWAWVADAARRTISVFRIERSLSAELRYQPDLGSLVREYDLRALRDARDDLREHPVIEPGALAIGPDDTLFIADRVAGLVHHVDHRFRLLGVIGARHEFIEVSAMTLALDGTLLVADRIADRIARFDVGSGELVGEIDRSGKGVRGMDALSDGRLVISDGAHRVCVLGAQGAELRSWGSPGIGIAEFHLAAGVLAHDDDQITVVDWGNHRLQVFEDEGTFLDAIGSLQFVLPIQRERRRGAEAQEEQE